MLRILLFFILLIIVLSSVMISGFKNSIVIAKDNGLDLINSKWDSTLLTRQGVPFSVDFLHLSNKTYKLFWSDLQNRSIYSGLLHNNKLTDVSSIIFSKGTIEGISIDWIGGHVYWVNSDFGLIEVATLSGKFQSPLITNLIKPRALGVDPIAGWLFWSDWNEASPHIGRSTLSGRNISTIITIDDGIGGWINAITLDYMFKKIYWIDAKSNHISEATYDGHNHRLIYAIQHAASPMGIAVYDNKIMWSDNGISSLLQVNISSEEEQPKVLYESFSKLYGVRVLKDTIDMDTHNPCANNNGGCSHICFAIGYSVECHCPYGMLLSSDNKNCQSFENALVIFYRELEKENSLVYIQDIRNPSWPVKSSAFLKESSGAVSFEYNSTAESVIWLDTGKNKVILEKGFGNQNTLLETFEGTKSFALDKHSRDIYLGIGGKNPQISHCSIEMHAYTCIPLLLEDIGEPLNLFIYHEERLLIWLNKLATTTKIESLNLSNKEQRKVITEGKDLCCMTVNQQRKEILWFNKNEDRIYWKSLDDKESSSWAIPMKIPVVALVAIDNFFAIASLNSIISVNVVDKSWFSTAIHKNGTIMDMKTATYTSELPSKSLSIIQVPEFSKYDNSSEENDSLSDLFTVTVQKENVSEPPMFKEKEFCTRDCKNGGKCIKFTSGEESCDCKEGFIGSFCEKNVCDNYCYNGNCTLKRRKVSCLCYVGWRGHLCNQRIPKLSNQTIDRKEFNSTIENSVDWRIIERNRSELFGIKVSSILVEIVIIVQFLIIILLIFCLISRKHKKDLGNIAEAAYSQPLHKDYCNDTEECLCKHADKQKTGFVNYKKKLKEWLIHINSSNVKGKFPCLNPDNELLPKGNGNPNETTV